MEQEAPVEKIPNLELQQWAFALTLPDSLVSDKTAIKAKLLAEVTSNAMTPYYDYLTAKFKWPVDSELRQKMKDENAAKLKKFDEDQANAEENEGESEIRDIMENRANYLTKIGDKEAAVEAFRITNEKTVGHGGKIDLVFSQIRLGLFYEDKELVQKNIEKAYSLVDQGGDWDRRNRLKVYDGLFSLSKRDFRKAAARLLDSVSTFTSSETLSFSQFAFYTVVVSVLALDRLDLKKQVVHAPEILSVIDDMPHVRDLMNSLYQCNYRDFMRALVHVTEALQRDRFLAAHASYFCREMRIKGYAQFLDSYKSVTMASMARAFGMSTQGLDKELSLFIAAQRLNCKIDAVSGVIETTRPDTRNAQYMETIKLGDALTHRLQKLSRVINV